MGFVCLFGFVLFYLSPTCILEGARLPAGTTWGACSCVLYSATVRAHPNPAQEAPPAVNTLWLSLLPYLDSSPGRAPGTERVWDPHRSLAVGCAWMSPG